MKYNNAIMLAAKLIMVLLLLAIYERVYRISNETYIPPLPRSSSSNRDRDRDRQRQDRANAARSQRSDR